MKEKSQPTYYTFVKKDANPDISIRRVGVYAGKISKDIENKSPQSHYFIQLKNGIDVDTFISKYASITFEEDNTVGPKSISKQELICQLNLLFS